MAEACTAPPDLARNAVSTEEHALHQNGVEAFAGSDGSACTILSHLKRSSADTAGSCRPNFLATRSDTSGGCSARRAPVASRAVRVAHKAFGLLVLGRVRHVRLVELDRPRPLLGARRRRGRRGRRGGRAARVGPSADPSVRTGPCAGARTVADGPVVPRDVHGRSGGQLRRMEVRHTDET